MPKFEFDYDYINGIVNPDTSKIPLKGNEHRLVRVAFDFFRMKDDDTDSLWQVQADDDGQEFLVRTYSLPEEEKQKTASTKWAVTPDKKCENLTVAYHGVPIYRIAAAEYDAHNVDDVMLLKQTLLQKLAADKDFTSKVLSSLPTDKINMLQALGVNISEEAIQSVTAEDIMEEFQNAPKNEQEVFVKKLFEVLPELKEANADDLADVAKKVLGSKESLHEAIKGLPGDERGELLKELRKRR
jgi:hypothetical protein